MIIINDTVDIAYSRKRGEESRVDSLGLTFTSYNFHVVLVLGLYSDSRSCCDFPLKKIMVLG